MTIKLIEAAVVEGRREHETLTRASLKSCDTNREDSLRCVRRAQLDLTRVQPGTSLFLRARQERDSLASACTRLIIHILRKDSVVQPDILSTRTSLKQQQLTGRMQSTHTFPFKQCATTLHVCSLIYKATSALVCINCMKNNIKQSILTAIAAGL